LEVSEVGIALLSLYAQAIRSQETCHENVTVIAASRDELRTKGE
jgi:hypothetical protein